MSERAWIGSDCRGNFSVGYLSFTLPRGRILFGSSSGYYPAASPWFPRCCFDFYSFLGNHAHRDAGTFRRLLSSFNVFSGTLRHDPRARTFKRVFAFLSAAL
jgi:hypothetical protein